MDEDLKKLWKSNQVSKQLDINFKKTIEAFYEEEKKAIKTKWISTISMVFTSIYLIWLSVHYDWLTGIKFYGIVLIILDMFGIMYVNWFKVKEDASNQAMLETKEMTKSMVQQLESQIYTNKVIMPIYGLVLTIGIIMVYSDIVPKITSDSLIQILIYLSVVCFISILMLFGISKKNKHIKKTIQPLIDELKEYEIDA